MGDISSILEEGKMRENNEKWMTFYVFNSANI